MPQLDQSTAPSASRRVVAGALVDDLGIVLERQEAVQEAFRDPELPAVLGRELDPGPPPVGRAALPRRRPRRRIAHPARSGRACPARAAVPGSAGRGWYPPSPRANGCPARRRRRSPPLQAAPVPGLGKEAAGVAESGSASRSEPPEGRSLGSPCFCPSVMPSRRCHRHRDLPASHPATLSSSIPGLFVRMSLRTPLRVATPRAAVRLRPMTSRLLV